MQHLELAIENLDPDPDVGNMTAPRRDTNVERKKRLQRVLSGWQSPLSLYNTGVARYEDLNEDDRLRFNWLQAQRFAALELLLDLDRHHSIKPEVIDFVNDALRQDLSNSGVKMWWKNWGHNVYASDFRDPVSGILRSAEAAPRS